MSATRTHTRFVVVIELRQRSRLPRTTIPERLRLSWRWFRFRLRNKLRRDARQLSVINHVQNFHRFKDFSRAANVIWMRMRRDEVVELLHVVAPECVNDGLAFGRVSRVDEHRLAGR